MQSYYIFARKSYFCAMKDINQLELHSTDDGSATIFIPEMNEHYHSVKGAYTESCHIYRDCAFLHRCADAEHLRLLEVGFGTGLNAAVTAEAATDKAHKVHYISLEKYPLAGELVESLGYEGFVNYDIFRAIHDAEWNKPVEITPYFTLERRKCDYVADVLPCGIDVVYFDAFAPEKQPEMWSHDAFARLVAVMNRKAVLTTYCAKGDVRRLLASLGLAVERLAGPVGGKREILRAVKPDDAL